MSLSAHGALDDVLSAVTTPCHDALGMECLGDVLERERERES